MLFDYSLIRISSIIDSIQKFFNLNYNDERERNFEVDKLQENMPYISQILEKFIKFIRSNNLPTLNCLRDTSTTVRSSPHKHSNKKPKKMHALAMLKDQFDVIESKAVNLDIYDIDGNDRNFNNQNESLNLKKIQKVNNDYLEELKASEGSRNENEEDKFDIEEEVRIELRDMIVYICDQLFPQKTKL